MIEVNGVRLITGTEAASVAGISPGALRMRRYRERDNGHPRVVWADGIPLYREDEFRDYLARWVDGRGWSA